MSANTDRSEIVGGLVMLAAALAAVIWANSSGAANYHALVNWPLTVGFGAVTLHKSLELWVSDGLMAIFFLLVGLEIKREFLAGELSSRDRAALPAAAALGGMVVPALIFLVINRANGAGLRGWAVPCATDIAFSLAVLRIIGARAPQSLRVFLTAIAVLDDLGAIAIIAIFYTEQLSYTMLLAALVPIAALVVFNRMRVAYIAPYALAGFLLWVCVLKSGIHATLAGVVIAAAIPLSTARGDLAHRLEHVLKPWVVFGILPLFALVNAGVSLTGLGWGSVLAPVALGAAVGLVLGKTLGVSLGVAVAVGTGIARRPTGASWMHIVGVAALCGIGFTMSLLLAGLAYEGSSGPYFEQAKLGILLGSAVAAAAGVLALRMRGRLSD